MTDRQFPFGTQITDSGVLFNLYAQDADAIQLMIDGRPAIQMEDRDGWKSAHVANARAGDTYKFRLSDGLTFPDPASRFQPQGVGGPSEIIDPASYRWKTRSWRGRPWSEAVIYEAHIGAATEQGTYDAFAERLKELANLGVTLIELMPVAQWHGQRNWGYDGVLPFSPANAYGRPERLKALVDKAHDCGLMIVLDVVYNHFGPAGNYLNRYASSFFTQRHQTPWGAAINFDDHGRDAVRSYFIQNAIYWINEFKFDGLRLDAVHAIHDDSVPHILADIAKSVRLAAPDRHIHLILENDENQARWLAREHDFITPRHYTAQWNDDVHHCWHTALTGESEGYYADFSDNPPLRLGRALKEGFAYQGESSLHRKGGPRGEPSAELHPTSFIDFLQNHDQIGNRAFGERIDSLAPSNRLEIARATLLLSPHIPMFFMGEEWASQRPFLYFVDFSDEPDLADAVFKGRQAEFSGFSNFAVNAAAIPDPNAFDTFLRAKLDLAERLFPAHLAAYESTRRLLELRKRYIIPLLSSRYFGADRNNQPQVDHIDVTWRFEVGELRLIINLAPDRLEVALAHGEVVYSSPNAMHEKSHIELPSWSMIAIRS